MNNNLISYPDGPRVTEAYPPPPSHSSAPSDLPSSRGYASVNAMRRRICFSDPRTIRTIECRAAVSWEPNSKFVIENIEVAPPKKNEVRIKMTHSSICRSDLFGLAKLSPFTLFPIVLGHEGSGIVESVGEGVENLQPGDHVIPVFVPQCNECRACKCKKTNLCDAYSNPKFKGVQIFSSVMRDGTSRFTCKGKPIYHYLGLSTFSEYTVVADIQVAKINPEAPLEKVCLLGCGVATGYGAALNTAKVEEGSTCAVWGLGAIGLAVIMGCKKAGASRIIGIDVSPDKFVVAKKFGMTESINPNDYDKPIQQVLMDITDGGLDYAFECIGNVDVMRAALESCHKGWGVAVLLGIVGGDKEVSTKPFQIVTGRTLKGSIYGDWKRDDIPKLVEAYMNKDIQIDEFITHNKTIEEINEAFDLLRAAKCIRTVMTF